MNTKAQTRYSTPLTTLKLKDGRTVYRTARPKVVVTDVQDVVIYADERDRADIIANNAYGSAMDWWRIASANAKVDGSLCFTPGQEVTIPRNI